MNLSKPCTADKKRLTNILVNVVKGKDNKGLFKESSNFIKRVIVENNPLPEISNFPGSKSPQHFYKENLK